MGAGLAAFFPGTGPNHWRRSSFVSNLGAPPPCELLLSFGVHSMPDDCFIGEERFAQLEQARLKRGTMLDRDDRYGACIAGFATRGMVHDWIECGGEAVVRF